MTFTDPLDDMYHEAIDDSRHEAVINPEYAHEYSSRKAALQDFPKEEGW